MRQITDELLLAYIDGDLQGDDLQLVESALEADPSLQAHLNFIREMEHTASDTLRRTAPNALSFSVMNEVHAHAPVHQAPEKRSNGALYAFLVLIGTFMGISLLTPPKESASGVSFAPVAEWFRTAFGRIGDMFAGSGEFFQGFSINAPNTMMLAIVAVLLLALLDMYFLRPLSKKNGHQ